VENIIENVEKLTFFIKKTMNEIEKFRKVFIIFGNFSKFSSI